MGIGKQKENKNADLDLARRNYREKLGQERERIEQEAVGWLLVIEGERKRERGKERDTESRALMQVR